MMGVQPLKLQILSLGHWAENTLWYSLLLSSLSEKQKQILRNFWYRLLRFLLFLAARYLFHSFQISSHCSRGICYRLNVLLPRPNPWECDQVQIRHGSHMFCFSILCSNWSYQNCISQMVFKDGYSLLHEVSCMLLMVYLFRDVWLLLFAPNGMCFLSAHLLINVEPLL